MKRTFNEKLPLKNLPPIIDVRAAVEPTACQIQGYSEEVHDVSKKFVKLRSTIMGLLQDQSKNYCYQKQYGVAYNKGVTPPGSTDASKKLLFTAEKQSPSKGDFPKVPAIEEETDINDDIEEYLDEQAKEILKA
mmetsp:Transcript_18734/g.28748  ORF Transcript_18734/g.28748 Transcript_18734/m.28748 type:complete len:134 (+) Transcript_18734:2-403(+)